MTDEDLGRTWRLAVLMASVFALLAAGVGNVLLAVTESVLWPLILGVVWVVAAAAVTAVADVPRPSGSRTPPVEWVPAVVVVPARPR